MTTRSTIATSAAVLATAFSVLGVVSHAAAAPLDHGRFQESGSEVFEDFCGLDVVHNWDVKGNFLGRVTGSSDLAYYRDHTSGTHQYVNLDTGKSYTQRFTTNNHDSQVVDNGDGTLSIHLQGAGIDKWYDASGKLVLMNPGNVRYEILVDNAGTPNDPFDDELITFVDEDRGSTGRNDLEGRDFCDDFLQFTA